jgi:uncharacterized protein DUF3306
MSGPDDADRDRGFLARWSQRKQEAKQPEPKQDAPAGDSVESSGLPAPQGDDETVEFDLSTLPTLEELTGSTDITAFLRKGVPEHLRNAALRKSWALDPAIRNYVNPALEYAYDWNAPGGVPGGGELGAGVDVARLVSAIMGEPSAGTTSSVSGSENEAAHSPVDPSERDLSAKKQEDFAASPLRRSDERMAETEMVSTAKHDIGEPAAANESQPERPAAPQQLVRRHGTAKPIG